MKNKYTILLLPPDHGPAKQIQIPANSKRVIMAITLIISSAVGGLAVHDYLQTKYIKEHTTAFSHVDNLQATLTQKEEEIANLNKKASDMAKNLDDIEAFQEKISNILSKQPSSNVTNNSLVPTPKPQSYNQTAKTVTDNAELVEKKLINIQNYYQATLKYEDDFNHTPSIIPLEGEIASYFGYRKNPFGGRSSEFHNGVDIACNYATPVLTTADGVVTFSGWDNVYGRKVQIDHGNGIQTFYGHNARLTVKVGQTVKKGEIIAYSGNSGRSTGTHLHYGAIVNGKSVDPLMFTSNTREQ